MSSPEQEILKAVESLESGMVGLLQNLVRIPSITGNESDIQKYLSAYLVQGGLEIDIWFPTRNELDSHAAFSDDGLPLGNRPVLVAHLAGSDRQSPSLILNGHVDVVPVGDESAWSDSPWSGVLHDGCVWGRGSADMKGGLVSGIGAILALQKAGIKLRGDVWFQSVIGEETGGIGTLACVERGYRADAAVVLEPTRLAVCPIGAGAASFRIRVTGRAAHGAMRTEGVSAVEKFYPLFHALRDFERLRHEQFHHALFDANTLIAPLSIGKVQAGDWPSTVPDTLTAEGRFGIFPGEDIREARNSFEQTVRRAADTDPWLFKNRPMVEWFEGQFEPAHTSPDAPIVKAISSAHAAIRGIAPRVHGVPYGSDLRFFTNYARMDAVLYGPGDVRLAHSANEHIPVEEVITAAKVIAITILRWCSCV